MKSGEFKNFITRSITWAGLGVLFWTSFAYLPSWVFSIILLAIMARIVLFEWQKLFDVRKAIFWVTMPLYPILPFTLLIYMNHIPRYRSLLFLLFMIVFAHDTGAYIIGKFFGKHPIMPRISPGKTWEGFFGGCLSAAIGLKLALWELGVAKPLLFIIAFSVCVSILSVTGDLFESWLKRRAGVKDTGTILPGHGGFLDRFDGILFAVFFFYYFKDFLVTLFFEPLGCISLGY